MIVLGLLFALAVVPAKPASCVLTEADKVANAKLNFDEFDQKGVSVATARKLGERGCFAEAYEATVDYLIHGPVAQPGEQRVMLWHMGQFLAMKGEEKRAAEIMAATRRYDPAPPESGPLNWNDYVTGTWAFLVKDRNLLQRMRDRVLMSPGKFNAINGSLLAGMERCFDRPYIVAYDPKCGARK